VQRSRTVLIERNGKSYLVTELDEKPNLDHIETVSGSTSEFWMDWELADTRRIRPRQRRFFYAMLNDIVTHFDVPKDFLKDLFYTQYSIYTDGKEISLANDSQCSVSDANTLLDLVVDFMFEFRVPFKKGYELLPRNQEYYIYECCRHRRCILCGKENSQIAHYDAVGIRSRSKVDHRKLRFLCLCPEHHREQHNIGIHNFCAKYHLVPIKLNEETLAKLGVMNRKRMNEIDDKYVGTN
jgi:hypothetical protein